MRHLRPGTPARWLLVPALAALTLALGACASRYDQLRSKSSRVESALLAERSRVNASEAPDRDARLGHLSELRTTLSAANVGLGATRYMPSDQRDLAFDVLDEVYSAIEWNIPLGPEEAKRSLPLSFNVNGTIRPQQ